MILNKQWMGVMLNLKNRGELFVSRLIGTLGNGDGPTILFTGGIHGNEPSGVVALHDVIGVLRAGNVPVKGKLLALAGNLDALSRGIRYNTTDLNRIWTREKVAELQAAGPSGWHSEQLEQKEIYDAIQHAIDTCRPPFYFIDLHTTSVATEPFLTINDALINRRFAEKFEVPVILGLEEFLEGPLLSYINELGYVACGFEAGQHDSLEAYRNQVAFILLSLSNCGLLDPADLSSFSDLVAPLNYRHREFYEISYRYAIAEKEKFRMKPGLVNFEPVGSGELLAWSDDRDVVAPVNGQVFLPLYQAQGDDGFFIIRRLNRLVLLLSAWLRKIRVDSLLPLLPGVRWTENRTALAVNPKVARFFAREIFHLLGYRSVITASDHLIMRNRERVARTKDYKNYI